MKQCAICGKIFDGKICIDHNHQTQEIRGLLCHNCNTILGMSSDDPAILQKAIEYLETEKEKHWEGKPITVGDFTDTPKTHSCQCGCTPYTNYGNGYYWIECPACHMIGEKSMIQAHARGSWNLGRIKDGKGL